MFSFSHDNSFSKEDKVRTQNVQKLIFNDEITIIISFFVVGQKQDHIDLHNLHLKRDSIPSFQESTCQKTNVELPYNNNYSNTLMNKSLNTTTYRQDIGKQILVEQSLYDMELVARTSPNHKNINCSSRISHKSKKTLQNFASDYFEERRSSHREPSNLLQQNNPRRIMGAINLLVNVKAFFRKLSNNTRLFEKLTIKQFNSIGDKSSTYEVKHKYWEKYQNSFLKLILITFRQMKIMILKLPPTPKLSPFGTLKSCWDSLQAACILVNFFIFSFFFFFKLDLLDFQQYLNLCVVIFTLDIIVNFNSGVLIEGNIIYDSKQIAVSYVKQNLLFDCLSQLPLLYFTSQSSYQQLDNHSLLLLLFFLKFTKLNQISERLYVYFGFQKNMRTLIDLIRCVFLIVCVCHVFSLLWYWMAEYEIQLGRQDTWLQAKGLIDSSIWKRYIYSFYFLSITMITVGYGDITPQNVIEVTFTIITMFITAVFWAYFLNKVGNIIENIEKQDKNYNKNMEIIHRLMREEQVDSNLRVKVSNYLKYLFKEFNEVQKNSEKKIINKLSKQLQRDLLLSIQGKYLKQIPIIEKLRQKEQIAHIMEEVIYSPGEFIYQQCQQDDCSLYYIVKGQVDILFSSDIRGDCIISSLDRNRYFGEISFILGQQRNFSAKAITFCRIYKIPRDRFLEVIKKNDYDLENFQMTKDALFLKNNFKFCHMGCYICNSCYHVAQYCPKTHLTLPKQTLICRYNSSFAHVERQRCTRKRTSKFQTILNIQHCHSAVFEINDNKDLFDILDNLESIVNPSQELTSSEDIEQVDEKDIEHKEELKKNLYKTFGHSKQSLFSKHSQHYEACDSPQIQFEHFGTMKSNEKLSKSVQGINQSQQRFSLSSLQEKLAFEEKQKLLDIEPDDTSNSTLQRSQSLNSPTNPHTSEKNIQNNNEVGVNKQNNSSSLSPLNQQTPNNKQLKLQSLYNNNNGIQQHQDLSNFAEEEFHLRNKQGSIFGQRNQAIQEQNENEQKASGQSADEFLSSLSVRSRVPTRMLQTNDKKLNSFNSLKEPCSVITQKKQSELENIGTSTYTNEQCISPKNLSELKQKSQFQQQIDINSKSFPHSPLLPSSQQQQMQYQQQMQQSQQQYQILQQQSQSQQQQQHMIRSNSSHYQKKKQIKPSSQLLNISSQKNLSKKQITSLSQLVADNTISQSKSQQLPISTSNLQFQIKSLQKLLETSIISTLAVNSVSPQFIQSSNKLKNCTNPSQSDSSLGLPISHLKNLKRLHEQLNHVSDENNETSQFKGDSNYFLLQTFDVACIFEYYNPYDNYDHILLKFQKIQAINLKTKRQNIPQKKDRKKSRFQSVISKYLDK